MYNKNNRSGGGRHRAANKFNRTNRTSRNNKRSGNKRGARRMPTFNPSMFINQNPVDQKTEDYKHKNEFKDFKLNNTLLENVSRIGIKIPTPIQDQIIPEIINNRDVIGIAETGTGKTAAFLIPLIDQIIQNPQKLVLVLTPTRELAIQINSEFMKLSKGLSIFSTTCVGGMNIRPQIKSLYRKNNFIIGTPGRVMDLINRKVIKTQLISGVVLDESDRMLDMGFINDMKNIVSQISDKRQTLFFSATMNKEVEKISQEFLKNPVSISVKKKDVSNSIEQDVVSFHRDRKFETLVELFRDENFKKVIVFGNMKHSVEKLCKDLNKSGIKSTSIHGNKNHGQRQKALSNFKNEEVQVLVATDVAARGIHVDRVSHVVNYDLPATFDDYIHRIGRTGRSTEKGKALTFIQG